MSGIDTPQNETISALSLFSGITLRELVDEEDGSEAHIRLSRDISFPDQLQHMLSCGPHIWEFSAQARPPPEPGYHLELEIGDLIGRGSSGHVYSVRVLGISSDSTDNPQIQGVLDTIPDLCIKLSEPNRIRTIAREAWYYEQLDAEGLQGVAVPRNYGLFTASCSSSRVIPWRAKSWKFRRMGHDIFKDFDGSGSMRLERLFWEPNGRNPACYDDEHGSHQKSKWLKYRQSCTSPLVAVMLMEKLGEPPKTKDLGGFVDPEHTQDVRDLIEDLAWKGFSCMDLRWNQFVFAPNATPCPRHHRKHTFNLVDFGMTQRIPLVDKERQYVKKAMLYEGLEDTAFWGII